MVRLLFKRDEVHKPVGRLSGGKRVKTALAEVFAQEVNVLLLDEPTNYLNIFFREALENVLMKYPGTLLVASHDRHFVERVANRLIFLREGQAEVIEG